VQKRGQAQYRSARVLLSRKTGGLGEAERMRGSV
jgi:hypothetical protein